MTVEYETFELSLKVHTIPYSLIRIYIPTLLDISAYLLVEENMIFLEDVTTFFEISKRHSGKSEHCMSLFVEAGEEEIDEIDILTDERTFAYGLLFVDTLWYLSRFRTHTHSHTHTLSLCLSGNTPSFNSFLKSFSFSLSPPSLSSLSWLSGDLTSISESWILSHSEATPSLSLSPLSSLTLSLRSRIHVIPSQVSYLYPVGIASEREMKVVDVFQFIGPCKPWALCNHHLHFWLPFSPVR